MARPKEFDAGRLFRDTVKDLRGGASEYMRSAGQSKVKVIEHQVIDEEIYQKYTPKVYKRRGSEKGLKDVRNMKSSVTLDKSYSSKVTGHLTITNKTKRNVLPGSKKKYDYVNDHEDFLYMIKDEGRVYDLWAHSPTEHSSSYEQWGNGGRPLNLNKAIDEKVQKSKEFRSSFKRATLKYANQKKNSRKG